MILEKKKSSEDLIQLSDKKILAWNTNFETKLNTEIHSGTIIIQ